MNTQESIPMPSCVIGTWAWGSGMNGSRMIFGQRSDEERLHATFQRALEAGFTYWDSAEVYGNGESERILGECLRSFPGARISTKHAPGKKFVPGAMEKSLAASCARLGIASPDLYFLHSPSNIEQNTHAAVELLRTGRIGSFGLSNVTLQQVLLASGILATAGFRLGAVQNHFSLLSEPDLQAPLVQWCTENDVPFFAYMVLEQGALSGRYDSNHPFPPMCLRSMMFPRSKFRRIEPLLALLRSLSEKHGVPVSQIPIAWARAKGTMPLVGLTKPEHADQLALGSRIQLSTEEITSLDESARATGVVCKGVWET